MLKNKTPPVKMGEKLIDQIGLMNAPVDPDLFGFEIELEGQNIKTEADNIMNYFVMHNDGSLRANKPNDQAVEYVFKKPFNLDKTEAAIRELFYYLNKPDVKVYDSYRTSIHVHLNFLQETNRTIVNFITLAIIFDELFVSQNGRYRKGNNFCLRTRDAEGQIHTIASSIAQYGNFHSMHENHRYSSFNLVSLLKFGTIEFRSLECSRDFYRVWHWIETLASLKKAAREFKDPREIIAKFSRRGPLGFMVSMLGNSYAKYAAVEGSQEMLRDGMRLAQDFAFCSDWQEPEPNVAPKRKPKNMDEYLKMKKLAMQNPQQWGFPVPQQHAGLEIEVAFEDG